MNTDTNFHQDTSHHWSSIDMLIEAIKAQFAPRMPILGSPVSAYELSVFQEKINSFLIRGLENTKNAGYALVKDSGHDIPEDPRAHPYNNEALAQWNKSEEIEKAGFWFKEGQDVIVKTGFSEDTERGVIRLRVLDDGEKGYIVYFDGKGERYIPENDHYKMRLSTEIPVKNEDSVKVEQKPDVVVLPLPDAHKAYAHLHNFTPGDIPIIPYNPNAHIEDENAFAVHEKRRKNEVSENILKIANNTQELMKKQAEYKYEIDDIVYMWNTKLSMPEKWIIRSHGKVGDKIGEGANTCCVDKRIHTPGEDFKKTKGKLWIVEDKLYPDAASCDAANSGYKYTVGASAWIHPTLRGKWIEAKITKRKQSGKSGNLYDLAAPDEFDDSLDRFTNVKEEDIQAYVFKYDIGDVVWLRPILEDKWERATVTDRAKPKTTGGAIYSLKADEESDSEWFGNVPEDQLLSEEPLADDEHQFKHNIGDIVWLNDGDRWVSAVIESRSNNLFGNIYTLISEYGDVHPTHTNVLEKNISEELPDAVWKYKEGDIVYIPNNGKTEKAVVEERVAAFPSLNIYTVAMGRLQKITRECLMFKTREECEAVMLRCSPNPSAKIPDEGVQALGDEAKKAPSPFEKGGFFRPNTFDIPENIYRRRDPKYKTGDTVYIAYHHSPDHCEVVEGKVDGYDVRPPYTDEHRYDVTLVNFTPRGIGHKAYYEHELFPSRSTCEDAIIREGKLLFPPAKYIIGQEVYLEHGGKMVGYRIIDIEPPHLKSKTYRYQIEDEKGVTFWVSSDTLDEYNILEPDRQTDAENMIIDMFKAGRMSHKKGDTVWFIDDHYEVRKGTIDMYDFSIPSKPYVVRYEDTCSFFTVTANELFATEKECRAALPKYLYDVNDLVVVRLHDKERTLSTAVIQSRFRRTVETGHFYIVKTEKGEDYYHEGEIIGKEIPVVDIATAAAEMSSLLQQLHQICKYKMWQNVWFISANHEWVQGVIFAQPHISVNGEVRYGIEYGDNKIHIAIDERDVYEKPVEFPYKYEINKYDCVYFPSKHGKGWYDLGFVYDRYRKADHAGNFYDIQDVSDLLHTVHEPDLRRASELPEGCKIVGRDSLPAVDSGGTITSIPLAKGGDVITPAQSPQKKRQPKYKKGDIVFVLTDGGFKRCQVQYESDCIYKLLPENSEEVVWCQYENLMFDTLDECIAFYTNLANPKHGKS